MAMALAYLFILFKATGVTGMIKYICKQTDSCQQYY